MRRRQDLSNKLRRRPYFLTEFWWVVCPIDIVCNSIFLNHSSKSSYLNKSINQLMNELTFGRPRVRLFSPLDRDREEQWQKNSQDTRKGGDRETGRGSLKGRGGWVRGGGSKRERVSKWASVWEGKRKGKRQIVTRHSILMYILSTYTCSFGV